MLPSNTAKFNMLLKGHQQCLRWIVSVDVTKCINWCCESIKSTQLVRKKVSKFYTMAAQHLCLQDWITEHALISLLFFPLHYGIGEETEFTQNKTKLESLAYTGHVWLFSLVFLSTDKIYCTFSRAQTLKQYTWLNLNYIYSEHNIQWTKCHVPIQTYF